MSTLNAFPPMQNAPRPGHVHNRLCNHINEHREVLAQLREVASVPDELEAARAELDEARAKLKEERDSLRGLQDATRKERKEWEAVDTTDAGAARRFWLHLSHGGRTNGGTEKLAAAQEKEEAEYLAAQEQEDAALARIQELEAEQSELEARVVALRPASIQHAALRRQLEEMYASVFGGDSPAFPEEDAAEAEVKRAEVEHRETTAKLGNADRALRLLTVAGTALRKGAEDIGLPADQAAPVRGVKGVRDALVGLSKRQDKASAMEDAHAAFNRAKAQTAKARELWPAVGDMPAVFTGSVAAMPTAEDHPHSLQATQQQLVQHLGACEVEVRVMKRYGDAQRGAIVDEVTATRARLHMTQDHLDSVRREIFERVAGGQGM